MHFFVVLSATAVFFVTTIAIDYCDLDLCPEGRRHVGCAENGCDWGSKCSDDRSLENMTKELKYFILKKHNKARNRIALGRVPGYLEADRMPEMMWDTDLERHAELNVKRCKYGHDQCRNTDQFKLCGQNIGIVTGNYTLEAIDVVNIYFDLWFDEHKDCNMSYIDDYQLLVPATNEVKIGHFTQIVAMRSKYVGCAMSTFYTLEKEDDEEEDYEKNYYLVCNYSFGNAVSEPIYTTGPTASRCRSGRSLTYKGLCNSTEDIQAVLGSV